MFRAVLCGITGCTIVGPMGCVDEGIVAVAPVGVMLRAELCGSIMRAVLAPYAPEPTSPGIVMRGDVAGAGFVAAGVAAATGVGAAGDGAATTVGVTASPDACEKRPLLCVTLSFVITGSFDFARLERLASATSGESSAETMAVASSIPMTSV